MSTYNVLDLVKEHNVPQEEVDKFLKAVTSVLTVPGIFAVFPWDEAPKDICNFCSLNGGDEDWLIVTYNDIEEWRPWWINCTDTCNSPDVYKLEVDGRTLSIIVGCHA